MGRACSCLCYNSAMNIEDAAQFVAAAKPSLLYISGKTCTGKTTFAREVATRDGYAVIALDDIVYDAVIRPLSLQAKEGHVFVSVYRTGDVPDWVDRFVIETRKHIAKYEAQKIPVLIEGSIANPDVINRILAGTPDAQTLYFHPKATSGAYLHNLLSRFKGASVETRNGLPNDFWKSINPDDFAQFCIDGIVTSSIQASIVEYCKASIKASDKRLATFKQHLKHLQVVEI
jgi:hypothetical protein